MGDSQLEREGIQGGEEQGTWTGSREGPISPTLLAKTTPSSTFIKENIDVTAIRSKARSFEKSQRSLSRSKTLSQLRRSERPGNRSKLKTKANEGRAKFRMRKPRPKKVSSDSDYEGDLEDTCEDLSTPYKRPKPTPFTSRITHFRYHRRAKLHRNVKVYEGSKDLEDHLGIFSAAAEQEEWSMTHGKLQITKLEILRVLVAKETLKEILMIESINFPPPPPLIGTPEKQNLNKLCGYHRDRGNPRNKGQGRGGVKVINMVSSGWNQKRPYEMAEPRVMGEITSFGAHTRSKLRKSSAPLVSFFGEIYHPLGLMDIQVTMGESSRSKTTLLEFAIVKHLSHYTVILGRIGIRSLGAVGSTIHLKVKFSMVNRVATLRTIKETLRECRRTEETQNSRKETQ
ncbi:hypothetical protein Tco_0996465 [Tanacetum coccineum]